MLMSKVVKEENLKRTQLCYRHNKTHQRQNGKFWLYLYRFRLWRIGWFTLWLTWSGLFFRNWWDGCARHLDSIGWHRENSYKKMHYGFCKTDGEGDHETNRTIHSCFLFCFWFKNHKEAGFWAQVYRRYGIQGFCQSKSSREIFFWHHALPAIRSKHGSTFCQKLLCYWLLPGNVCDHGFCKRIFLWWFVWSAADHSVDFAQLYQNLIQGSALFQHLSPDGLFGKIGKDVQEALNSHYRGIENHKNQGDYFSLTYVLLAGEDKSHFSGTATIFERNAQKWSIPNWSRW